MLVLWDIDKTLTYSPGKSDLFIEAIHGLGGDIPPERLPEKDGKTDGEIAREYLMAANMNEKLFDAYMERLEVLSERVLAPGSLCMTTGAPDALDAVARMHAINGIYTGNTRVRARLKLSAAGYDVDRYFAGLSNSASYCLGRARHRLDAVETVLLEHPGEKLLVVGDAPLDLELARRLDAAFWHVGSGFDLTNDHVLGESADFSGARLDYFVREVRAYGAQDD